MGPPPARGGAELLEARKILFGLNYSAPRAPEMIFDWPKAWKRIWPESFRVCVRVCVCVCVCVRGWVQGQGVCSVVSKIWTAPTDGT